MVSVVLDFRKASFLFNQLLDLDLPKRLNSGVFQRVKMLFSLTECN